MSYDLKLTFFGDPILRKTAKRLSPAEIRSPRIQELVQSMQARNETEAFGVGVAAPQFGVGVALFIVGIKPTPTRPNLERQELVVFNPEIVKTYGNKTGMWEACWSFGGSGSDDFPYAQAMRYKKVRLKYLDENAAEHERDFEGMLAHVIQHETDHLNGILYVDRVSDTKTYCMKSEYVKRHATGK